jgi:hypothetical protein
LNWQDQKVLGAGSKATPSAIAAAAAAEKSVSIYFVPRRTMLCEKVLEDRGVYGDVVMGEFHLDLIPLDDDVVSMELHSVFREVFIDGDPTSLYYVAKALMKMQHLFGLIPNIKGKGDAAHQVVRLLMRLRREAGDESFAAMGMTSDIDTLVIFDRASDMTTPLLTHHTYEGLVDELFEIKCNCVGVDSEVFSSGAEKSGKDTGKAAAAAAAQPKKPEKVKLYLNSADILFQEIRDMNFSVLGPHLHQRASQVRETYEERHKQSSVAEMADYMKKFKNSHQEHSLLHVHINLAEKLANETKSAFFRRRLDAEQLMISGSQSEDLNPEEYVEECLAKREPIHRVLRLLALYSMTQGGIKTRKYESLKHEILQTYGFEYLFTLNNMERLGILKPEGRAPWPIVRKSLRLITDSADLKNLEDVSAPYSGYVPLLVRLLEVSTKPVRV